MATTYESALQVAEGLSKEDKLKLARKLLTEAEEPAAPGERVSIMELKGLGKEIWEGIDPVAYVRAERDSWDS